MVTVAVGRCPSSFLHLCCWHTAHLLTPRWRHFATVPWAWVNSGSRVTARPTGHSLPVSHHPEAIATPGMSTFPNKDEQVSAVLMCLWWSHIWNLLVVFRTNSIYSFPLWTKSLGECFWYIHSSYVFTLVHIMYFSQVVPVICEIMSCMVLVCSECFFFFFTFQKDPRRGKKVPKGVRHRAPGSVVHRVPLEKSLPAVCGLRWE